VPRFCAVEFSIWIDCSIIARGDLRPTRRSHFRVPCHVAKFIFGRFVTACRLLDLRIDRRRAAIAAGSSSSSRRRPQSGYINCSCESHVALSMGVARPPAISFATSLVPPTAPSAILRRGRSPRSDSWTAPAPPFGSMARGGLAFDGAILSSRSRLCYLCHLSCPSIGLCYAATPPLSADFQKSALEIRGNLLSASHSSPILF
jgi:hypothetical protein